MSYVQVHECDVCNKRGVTDIYRKGAMDTPLPPKGWIMVAPSPGDPMMAYQIKSFCSWGHAEAYCRQIAENMAVG